MNIINTSITIISHLVFISLSYQMLISLFDWSKIIKIPAENEGKLRLFLLFLSIALGYLVSSFLLAILQLSQEIVMTIS
ncbi:DUF1146 family protein [Streptococcus dentiloxodontae]